MFLTRAPLGIATSFDLHVLGLPPAFVLSQNQTLKLSVCVFFEETRILASVRGAGLLRTPHCS